MTESIVGGSTYTCYEPAEPIAILAAEQNYYMKGKIHSRKYLKLFRRILRKRMTPAEAYLWKCLKSRQLCNRRFNRQFSIENYIVDFYCHQERLVIELDGAVHFTPTAQEKDRIRDERLRNLGYTVLRFENKMVFDKLAFVLGEIETHFRS